MIITGYFLISMLISIQLLLYWQAQLINSSETIKIERVVEYGYSPTYMFNAYIIIKLIIGLIIYLLTKNFYIIATITSLNLIILGLTSFIYKDKLERKFILNVFNSFVYKEIYGKKISVIQYHDKKSKEIKFGFTELRGNCVLFMQNSEIVLIINGRAEYYQLKAIKNKKKLKWDLSDFLIIRGEINKHIVKEIILKMRNQYEIHKLHNDNNNIFRSN